LERIICQFSCGAASAVATKLTLAKYAATHEVLIVNAFIQQEHDDNRRFLAECEQWFGRPITVLRDEKYNASTVEVFRRERFMKGPRGAPCTKILKRRLLSQLERPGDVIVFGFTAEEADRADDFRERNPDRPMIAPLIDAGLGKEDCKAMVLRAGIELPLMYRMGYDNANCIGCVKGGMGYWRAIREDFPEQFEELARVQEEIGPGANLHLDRKTNERFSLRALPAGEARRNEKLPSCSFFCEMAEQEYSA
jgi:3'-phosphoadenosine 5'-phosphosulfate sulfotransferase (PAPS reductase)/FAD synthetase